MKQNEINKFVPDGRLTGKWNEPRGQRLHKGIDIAPPKPGQTGVMVYAGIEGKVVSVGGRYGTVTIKTSDGYTVQYLHFEKFEVEKDEWVTPDTILGEMGGRGPNGPSEFPVHVHIQVKDQNGELIDPAAYFCGRGSAVDYECPDNWPPPGNKKKGDAQPGLQG